LGAREGAGEARGGDASRLVFIETGYGEGGERLPRPGAAVDHHRTRTVGVAGRVAPHLDHDLWVEMTAGAERAQGRLTHLLDGDGLVEVGAVERRDFATQGPRRTVASKFE